MEWEVGKTYKIECEASKAELTKFSSSINRCIVDLLAGRPFRVEDLDDDVDVVWFVGLERKYFREVETVKEPEEKVNDDSKIVGQLKRLFSSRYGLTMVKFGEANEGKTFERFDDFIAALDKMDEIMQDRQKIKDLQEDIKRREVEFLIGKERGW